MLNVWTIASFRAVVLTDKKVMCVQSNSSSSLHTTVSVQPVFKKLSPKRLYDEMSKGVLFFGGGGNSRFVPLFVTPEGALRNLASGGISFRAFQDDFFLFSKLVRSDFQGA